MPGLAKYDGSNITAGVVCIMSDAVYGCVPVGGVIPTVVARICIEPRLGPTGSFVSTPTYEPVEAVLVGAATYTFKSRVVTTFVFETSMPRLLPPPFERTLMVEPLRQLKEKDSEVNDPVPFASTPYTFDVPPTVAVELSTVKTEGRNLDVTDDVPPKTIPFNV